MSDAKACDWHQAIDEIDALSRRLAVHEAQCSECLGRREELERENERLRARVAFVEAES